VLPEKCQSIANELAGRQQNSSWMTVWESQSTVNDTKLILTLCLQIKNQSLPFLPPFFNFYWTKGWHIRQGKQMTIINPALL
jgi:hypothetical protein